MERLRSIYKGGFKTEASATKWALQTEAALLAAPPMKGMGPSTTFAIALRDFAFEHVVRQKSAQSMVARINPYLESVGLPILEARARPDSAGPVYFDIAEKPTDASSLPRTFDAYRKARLAKRPHTRKMRETLAALPVRRIAPHHISDLQNAMGRDGLKISSINNELSILSRFFEHARSIWLWKPLENPCDDVPRKAPNNKRSRVLSASEQERLADALEASTNPFLAPFVWFAIETAMRKSEMLVTARWQDIDRERRILHLRDAKSGQRDVPLSREALELLDALPHGADDERIFRTTADAIDSAWERACRRANIENLRIHDLRHTGATRHAKRFNGNIFLLQLMTGHKSLEMLKRYVNTTSEDAVAALDATRPVLPPPKTAAPDSRRLPDNVIQIPAQDVPVRCKMPRHAPQENAHG